LLTRGKPQEEPSAGKPHARIWEGKSRMAALLDITHPIASRPLRQKGSLLLPSITEQFFSRLELAKLG